MPATRPITRRPRYKFDRARFFLLAAAAVATMAAAFIFGAGEHWQVDLADCSYVVTYDFCYIVIHSERMTSPLTPFIAEFIEAPSHHHLVVGNRRMFFGGRYRRGHTSLPSLLFRIANLCKMAPTPKQKRELVHRHYGFLIQDNLYDLELKLLEDEELLARATAP